MKRSLRHMRPDSYDIQGPCFQFRRMDEGPALNRIGLLAMFLYLLGIRNSTQELFDGNVSRPKYGPLQEEL